jgi:hypothetical protein
MFPVGYSFCPLPYRLCRLQHIDFTINYNKCFKLLFDTLNLIQPTDQKVLTYDEGYFTKLNLMDQQRIFFSYSHDDASEFALRLYNDLKDAGADVWIDQNDIKELEKYGMKQLRMHLLLHHVYYSLFQKRVQNQEMF